MSTILKDFARQFLLPLWQDKSLEVIEQFVAPSADEYSDRNERLFR
jgi:hypothetical protein